MSDKPLFVIKRNLQKSAQTRLSFQNQLDDESLKDICLKITGRSDYNCQYVDNDYSDVFCLIPIIKGVWQRSAMETMCTS